MASTALCAFARSVSDNPAPAVVELLARRGAPSRGIADHRELFGKVDAVSIAADNPDRQVVFFGVGFETTAPANAMAVFQAKQRGLTNFSMLVSHVLVPPAIEALMNSDRKSTRLNSSHIPLSRMPSSA